MRRVIFTVALIGLAVILIAPLSIAGTTKADAEAETVSEAPVAVQQIAVESTGMRDEAAMVLIGSVLIGLGAAVRRAA